jgi:RecA-family ATPase
VNLLEVAKQSEQQNVRRLEKARGNVTVIPEPAEDWHVKTVRELSAMNIPLRNTVLEENGSPVFYEASVNQILAWRGVGKTMFGLGLADAIAGGGQILDFKADRPRRVLYIDGELPLKQLQERTEDLVHDANRQNVQIFNPEMLPKPRGLDLLNGRDFAALERLLDKTKPEVLILDSQSTLMSGDSNKTEFQEGRLHILRSLRWRGLCIIEMHHVGKGGSQRGLSRNDDILDVQMHLQKVPDWDPQDGLLFAIKYEKVRHAARLESDYVVTREDGKWMRRPSDEVLAAAESFKQGKTEREVAKDLKCSTGKAHKLRTKAMAAGLIPSALTLG